MDDADLVRRMHRGEERAFDEFFDANFDRLFRFAVRRLGDGAAAEDVAQATLAQAVRKLHTWRGEAALFTWLCAICRREVMAWAARNRHPLQQSIDDDPVIAGVLDHLADAHESPEQVAARGELAALIQSVLDHLPHRYGDVLEWKYLLDWPVQRIATRLGVTDKAAESMLTRARDAFRDGFSAATAAKESAS